MYRNLLIAPDRVVINPYFRSWRPGFRLAGFLPVTPYTAPPTYDTWTNAPYNRFCAIATDAAVDGQRAFVLPVFINDEPTDVMFDDDNDKDDNINETKPFVAFFLGNDDWHYALRYTTASERDRMIEVFGEDLGCLTDDLIGHN